MKSLLEVFAGVLVKILQLMTRKTTESSNTFTNTITDLVTNTTYYFRIYATNSDNKSTMGTSYGAQ
ncbi:fibronectin type III domain-containing protein [Psychroflexus sp. MES1-P1E]|uniref:fibronectin type III domain-containing protein n=1 Tax=Psychroflexus sp. MES1-P1E TaxID=2058320 RepID=UPI0011AEAF8F|nr:fibronectin type III domain-containing protein [Psychroflexus sp. MES1-P1E]